MTSVLTPHFFRVCIYYGVLSWASNLSTIVCCLYWSFYRCSGGLGVTIPSAGDGVGPGITKGVSAGSIGDAMSSMNLVLPHPVLGQQSIYSCISVLEKSNVGVSLTLTRFSVSSLWTVSHVHSVRWIVGNLG